MGTRERRGGRRAAALGAATLALALAAPAPHAASDPGPCEVVVTAEPSRLEARAPRAVRLRIALPPPAAPAPPAPPRVGASVGRIDDLRPTGDGWEARWIAPDASVPRIAFLSVISADGARCGFAPVPLDGVGEAVVRTRREASVRVRIGERSFGPAVADAEGIALVPVEVPPGVDAAYDAADRRIPLDVPAVPHTALLLAQGALPAHAAGVVTGLLLATDPAGAPLRGATPALAASAGAVGAPEPAGPGAWRVSWSLPPGAAVEASLSASLPDEPPSRVALGRPAGPPVTARIALDRSLARVGEGPVVVSIALADAVGNAADGLVTGRADTGVVGAAERLAAGSYRLPWSLPATLGGRTRGEVAVTVGEAVARAQMNLSPGVPARLSLAPAEIWAVADGRAEVRLVAEVGDAEGNPVDAPPAAAAALFGEIDPPHAEAPGRFALVYRPREASAYGAEDVTVAVPPLSASARVLLRPRTSPGAISASTGLAVGPGGWLGLQAGAEASAWRWLGAQELGLSAALAFTRLRDDRTVAAGAGAASFTGEVRTSALLLAAAWRRAAGRKVTARASAGAGAARVESLVSAGGGPALSESAWVAAAGAAAAVGLRLGPGEVFLEARGTWLADPNLPSLDGAPSPLSLSIGYQLDVR